MVVVDAVAVEGERRVAEQQHRRWYHLLPPRGLLRRRLALRERGALLAGLAVDDVVLLDDAGAVLVRAHMLDGDEGEAPAAHGLLLDRLDRKSTRLNSSQQ